MQRSTLRFTHWLQHRSTRQTLGGLLLAILFTLAPVLPAATPAQAQPPDSQLGEAQLFLILFPQLRNLPAPNWLAPGMRATYIMSVGSGQGAGSGSAPVNYDVVAMENGWTIIAVKSWLDTGQGWLIPSSISPSVGLPAVGEFWLHPSVLVNAEAVAHQNLAVSRFNRQLANGNVIQVVRFQSQTMAQTGIATRVWEFNTADGLLVFRSESIPDTLDFQVQIADLRQVTGLVTQGQQAPNWARLGTEMVFTGSKQTTVAGAGQFTQPFAITSQIVAGAGTWSLAGFNMFANNSFASQGVNISGVGQIFGGYWLPRGVMNQIGAQEVVLDFDTTTGMRVSVGRTQNNEIFLREGVFANNGAPLYQTVLFYDPVLGALNGMYQFVITGNSQEEMELRRTGGSDLQQLNSLPEQPTTPPIPNDPVESDPDTDQSIEVELTSSSLTVELPANFVQEPVNTSVSPVLNVPSPPPGGTPIGDAFALMVSRQSDGELVGRFAERVTLRMTLPEVADAASRFDAETTPRFFHRTIDGWQPLDSDYTPQTRVITAQHDRGGVFAVFLVAVEEEPGNGDPDEEEPNEEEPDEEEPDEEEPDEEEPDEQDFATFLPSLLRN